MYRVVVTGHRSEQLDVALFHGLFIAGFLPDFEGFVGRVGDLGHLGFLKGRMSKCTSFTAGRAAKGQRLLQPAEDVGGDLVAIGFVEHFVSRCRVQAQLHMAVAGRAQGVGQMLQTLAVADRITFAAQD